MFAGFAISVLLLLATTVGGCEDSYAAEGLDAQTGAPWIPDGSVTGAETAAPPGVAPDGQHMLTDASFAVSDAAREMVDAGSTPGLQGAPGATLDASHSSADSSIPPVDPGRGITVDLKTVVIDLRNQQMGTLLLPVPYPVVLFRDGTACLSTRVVTDGLDLATHRSMFPRLWTEWRGESRNIELRKGMSWTRLRYQGEYPPLAKGTIFQGTYTYTSGAYFGISNGLAQRTYKFSADGSFAVDRSALLVTESGAGAGVSVSPSESGQYEIEGYSIRFRYADGATASAAIVHGAADPSVIYINDAAFLKN